MPELNQVELHCWNQQKELRAFHAANAITTMGYCPLARCQQFGKTKLQEIATRLGKTEVRQLRQCFGHIPHIHVFLGSTPTRAGEREREG